VSFLPTASKEAIKAMGQVLRSWHLANRSDKTLADLARMFNNVVQGWINYYGRHPQCQRGEPHPVARLVPYPSGIPRSTAFSCRSTSSSASFAGRSGTPGRPGRAPDTSAGKRS
jgi:hypothetical protein